MQLTILTENDAYFLEIGADMELDDLLSLVAVEADENMESLLLFYNGSPLTDKKKTLHQLGLTGKEEAVQLQIIKDGNAHASGSGSSMVGTGAVNDLERMRLSLLGDTALMAELRRTKPDLADAVANNPRRFAQLMTLEMNKKQGLEAEKNRQIALLNADPYDVEAQRKIEEAIRQEAVLENMEHAMEFSPESFGNVCMLYINVEVNGHKVKAFVDSGAQSTIISPDCAEACGIMRLIDERYSGMARGVGTAKILGRIHSAQIKLGGLHLPVGFAVLEGRDVDLLFGLDMLKRHQAKIDLEKNCLTIQGRDIPFLAEHELPSKARQMEEVAEELGTANASGSMPAGGVAPVEPKEGAGSGSFPGSGASLGSGSGASASAPAAQPADSGYPEKDIEAIINLGVSREQAIQTLSAARGDVDVAASLLF